MPSTPDGPMSSSRSMIALPFVLDSHFHSLLHCNTIKNLEVSFGSDGCERFDCFQESSIGIFVRKEKYNYTGDVELYVYVPCLFFHVYQTLILNHFFIHKIGKNCVNLYKIKIIIAMIVLILFFVTFLHLLGDGCGNSKSIRLIGDWLSFLANVVSCSCLTLYNSHSLIQLVSRSVSICLVLTSTTLNNYTNTIFNVSILFEHLSVYFCTTFRHDPILLQPH